MQASNSNPIFSLTISGLKVEAGHTSLGGLRLRRFQEEVYERTRSPGLTVVDAPTGSGKTLAMLLAAKHSLDEGSSAFILYPTKALIEDQLSSMKRLAAAIGLDAPILRVDSDTLSRHAAARGYRTHGEALLDLLSQPSLVLTNPDIAYTLLTMRFSRGKSLFQQLFTVATFCVDELHLFWGAQLQAIYTMLYLLSPGRRIVVSTATHDPEALSLLHALPSPATVKARESSGGDTVRHETLLHVYTLTPGPVLSTPEHADATAAITLSLLDQVGDGPPPRVVAIVNSLAFSELLAARLRESLGPGSVATVNSLTPPRERRLDAPVVVGTSAIEVGVDFDTPALVFEANNAPSFIQRLGRVSRKRPGVAAAILPHSQAQRLQEALSGISGEPLPYTGLVEAVRASLSPLSSYAGFIKSPHGAAAQLAIAYTIVEKTSRKPKLEEAAAVAEETLPPRLRGHVSELRKALEEKRTYPPLADTLGPGWRLRGSLRKLAKSYRKIGVRGAFTTLPAFYEQHSALGSVDVADLPKLDFDYAATPDELPEEARRAGAEPPIILVHGLAASRGAVTVTPLYPDGHPWTHRHFGFLTRERLRVDSGDPRLSEKIASVLDGLPALLVPQPSDWRLTSLPSRTARGRGWLIIGPDALVQLYMLLRRNICPVKE